MSIFKFYSFYVKELIQYQVNYFLMGMYKSINFFFKWFFYVFLVVDFWDLGVVQNYIFFDEGVAIVV